MSSMEYMRDLFNSLEELIPEDTGIKPVINNNMSIKACIFDIYGTLLISGSGDIDLSEISNENLATAFDHGGVDILLEEGCSEEFCAQVIQKLVETVKKHHQRAKQNGIPYPEINILDIWEEVLNELEKQHAIAKNNHFDLKKITGIFEILSNRVSSMPGMKEVIMHLNRKKIPLGIISNAQFYTPVIMNYFLTGTLSDTPYIKYFDPGLTVFSYLEKIAKPDIALFEKIKPELRERGIADDETLFIGNDMYKDIYAAHKAGFKTMLFAGDKRSLRLREEMEEVKGLQPDFIISELNQITEIL